MLAVQTPVRCSAILIMRVDTLQPSEGADLSQVWINNQHQTADAGWSSQLAMGRGGRRI